MTKKDYELFADRIYKWGKKNASMGSSELIHLAQVTADIFEEDNPRFNREKYITACYEGKHIRKSISGRA